MLHTRLTEAYGLEIPFISAGMAFVAMPPLVAAVSNSGGMGTLGAALIPPDGLRALIQAIKSMTSRPFGVNFITQFATDEHIDVCIEERIPVVSFFWNEPPKAFISKLHSAGIKAWMQVGSVQEALSAAEAGIDAVIAQGSEAGGHNRSTASTLTLVPAVVDVLGSVPVIASGGIADGRGLVAALALGAEAVWVGTRMVASQEAYAHEEYKQRIVATSAVDTTRTTLFGPEWPGQPIRVIRNRVVNEWSGREVEAEASTEPGEVIGQTLLGGQVALMPKFSALLPTPDTSGDFEEMCLIAGESAGLIHEVRPAKEIIATMMDEAKQIIEQRLAGNVVASNR